MTKERGASLIFIAIGIYGLIFTFQLPMGSMREPGPGILPLGLSILLLGSGILWLIFGKISDRGKNRIDWSDLRLKLITPLKILGLTVAFALSLDRLGFLLTSFLYLFILFFWVSGFRIWTAVGIALLMGAGSWYFFGKLLAVQLPQGIFL